MALPRCDNEQASKRGKSLPFLDMCQVHALLAQTVVDSAGVLINSIASVGGGGAFRSKMETWNLRFDTVPSYRGGTLADVSFSGERRPGALKSFKSWPQELQATTSTRNPPLPSPDDWSAATTRIIFKGAGKSRVVYVSEDREKVFKIGDKNDNKNEANANLPLWLVPQVCGFVEEAQFAGVRVSVLIVRACSNTLATLGEFWSSGGDMHCRLLRSWAPDAKESHGNAHGIRSIPTRASSGSTSGSWPSAMA